MRERKVGGYVRAIRKHAALDAKYKEREQALLERLMPLKRKLLAAEVDMKTRRQALTGGELAAAQRIIHGPIAKSVTPPEALQHFNNRHED